MIGLVELGQRGWNWLVLVGSLYGYTGTVNHAKKHHLNLYCNNVCHLSALPWLHQSCDRIVSAGYPLPPLIAKRGCFLVSVGPHPHTQLTSSSMTATNVPLLMFSLVILISVWKQKLGKPNFSPRKQCGLYLHRQIFYSPFCGCVCVRCCGTYSCVSWVLAHSINDPKFIKLD